MDWPKGMQSKLKDVTCKDIRYGNKAILRVSWGERNIAKFIYADAGYFIIWYMIQNYHLIYFK